ncbi:hypothetical protein BJ166DRAFT_591598 [Pestalotiopsis sp. NC0098]|nr:hypothetical protein BJ166DRAFT_591598 [Pestalotiopsis sp. NC0098]
MAALVRDANGNDINGGGQFGWFLKIGATPEAVAVLNDQPFLFAQLLVVLVIIGLQITFHWEENRQPQDNGTKRHWITWYPRIIPPRLT